MVACGWSWSRTCCSAPGSVVVAALFRGRSEGGGAEHHSPDVPTPSFSACTTTSRDAEKRHQPSASLLYTLGGSVGADCVSASRSALKARINSDFSGPSGCLD